MRTPFSRTGRGGPFLHPATLAGWGLGLACALAPAPLAAQAGGAGPDTVLVNVASATFVSANGVPGSATAASTVVVHRTFGVGLEPPREAVVFPGGRRVLSHVLENRGNGADRFALSVQGPAGWGFALHLDLDGDGALGPGDPLVEGPVALAAGASAALLLVADAPADAPETGVQVTVRAASLARPDVAAQVTDRLTVRRPLPALHLLKTVDRAQATSGDTLTYTLVFENRGDGPAAAAVLADTVPAGVGVVPGSLRLDGASLTDAVDTDGGSVSRTQGGRDLVRVAAGDLAPGARSTLAFRAVVGPQAVMDGSVSNVAVLTSGDLRAVSPAAVTALGTPELELRKERMGPDTVRVGELVAYRIRVANLSTQHPARELVVTDTVPAGLAFVSSSPVAEVEGRVLRWRPGTLEPGAAFEAELTLRAEVPDADAPIVNRAWAQATNAAAVDAAALGLMVKAFEGRELEVAKAAGVLEAGLGEAVPYVLTLRNVGPLPLRNIVVDDELPRGVRFVDDAVVGADSARARGRTVRFHVAGPLAPGAEHRIRYSVVLVSAEGSRLGNRAWAEAEGGRVRTDTATAWVRVRRGFAMESRILLGKVWIDRDGDGRQSPGEEAGEGIEVASADGEIVATDAHGRFSFRDLRPGAHVLRLDTLTLPAGMRLAPGVDPAVRIRGDGWTTPTLTFRLVPRESEAAAAPAAPAPAAGADSSAVATPAASVPALLASDERQAQERRAIVEGPGIRITSPADGTLLGTNRVYVGLRGEPGAQARLYDGEQLVGEGTLRPDGTFDFVSVNLAEGPHRLRAWMRNSWQRERWDSVAVHRSGRPARIESDGAAPDLRAEGREPGVVRVRVVDEWGVPVGTRPRVTVAATGAAVAAADVDPATMGHQLEVGPDGTLEVPLRAGVQVGDGRLSLSTGAATLDVPLRVLPTARPLTATGSLQVGVGAAPDAYGSLTVRGSLGEETAVTVTYDSRRGEEEDELFGRDYDPLDEARYPLLGDQSGRRVLGSATQKVTARVERGMDWVEVGDIRTQGFSGSERLGGYERSLTGALARVGTGPVTLRAFGSVTDQALVQQQIRADGASGPYRFGGPVRPGTERVALEVRARDNAARLVNRQELVRWVDYQIDYATGEVLLSRPVPAQDPYGNPIFVVALLERRSGGERRFVGGMRVEVDAARLLPAGAADSLGVALYGVHDASGGGLPGLEVEPAGLQGMEVRLHRGGLYAVAEVLRSASGDSTSVAGQAQLRWTIPGDRVTLSAGWLRVGDGFAAALNPRLRSGLQELSVATELRVAEQARLIVRHERQSFREFDVSRQSTTATVESQVGGRRVSAEAGLQTNEQTSGSSSIALGRAMYGLTPKADLWLEGTRALSSAADAQVRPDHVGLGMAYRITPGVRLEGLRRWVSLHEDSATYSVSSLNLRSELGHGARVWTGLERLENGGASHAAVLGWDQKLSLHGGWTVQANLERRFGLDQVPLADPVRALPFAQPERNRWSASMGTQWLPLHGPRFSARGEVHDGSVRRGWRFDVAGEAPFSASTALLTRHDWWVDRTFPAGVDALRATYTRRERSLLGFALRPTGSERLNALAKVEWRRTINPLHGSVVAGAAQERRLIGAGDVVWMPWDGFSVAGRYALRYTTAEDSLGTAGRLRSTAHYAGARFEHDLAARLRARLDGRLLSEDVTGTARWSLAPSLGVDLGGGIEVEGGYRFGDLQDPDFSAYGRRGWFALLGLRFTEGTVGTVADFWRERVKADL